MALSVIILIRQFILNLSCTQNQDKICLPEHMSPLCLQAPEHSECLISIWGRNQINKHSKRLLIRQPLEQQNPLCWP